MGSWPLPGEFGTTTLRPELPAGSSLRTARLVSRSSVAGSSRLWSGRGRRSSCLLLRRKWCGAGPAWGFDARRGVSHTLPADSFCQRPASDGPARTSPRKWTSPSPASRKSYGRNATKWSTRLGAPERSRGCGVTSAHQTLQAARSLPRRPAPVHRMRPVPPHRPPCACRP
jgi:hypothetical protein